MEKTKIEILAPAGSPDHLKAAVWGGADGVYLGTKEFNARRNAANFTFEQLEESVRLCHSRNVNVYVTVNTLVKNGELEDAVRLAKKLGEINVDGVIVQDLAIAEIFKNVCPQMPLHGSTQMAIHNLNGALTLKELGFSRVVLARELSIDEIRTITQNCGIETEVFVHGAHCMSASGMCYLSSFIGGRSGNRGKCAQPCRLDFKAGKNSFCLSLKDMCYVDHLEQLKNAGVASLKIEGRMKRPEYSYMAAKVYRSALDGLTNKETEILKRSNALSHEKGDVKVLRDIFSRSGFTDGYLMGKRNRDMFGYRKKEDVEAASRALETMGKLEEVKRFSVDCKIELCEGEHLKAYFSCNGFSVEVLSDIEIVKNMRFPTVDRIKEAVCKTGATPFVVNDVEVKISCESVEKITDSEMKKNENIPSVPVSAINALRREGLAKLENAISQRIQKQVIDYNLPENTKRKRKTETEYRIRVEKASQIGSFKGNVILPIGEADKLGDDFDKNRIILELPILIYPKDEQRITDELKRLKEKGFKNLLCENISFVKTAKSLGFKVYAGAYLNILNRASLSEYEKMGIEDITLSFEINDGDIGYFNSENKVGIIGYGHLGVMHMRNCPIKAFVGCKNCDKVIKDRLSKEFPILCRGEYVTMLNSVPLSVSGKSFPVDFITLYFTKETPTDVEKIINCFLKGNEFKAPHTKGLYFRKLI